MVTSGPKWPVVASVQRFDVRLQQLLDAMLSIGSDLSLPMVLQRIIESACKLVDARYGALGVVDDHGRLTDLATSGVDESTHEAVGRLPEFKGMLGVLLTDPKPLRLRDLSEHPLAQGFPPGHPEMTSFLGVPIRGKEAVGSLYLADKQSGDEFSEEDERLAVTLAAASGVAIDNARLQSSLEHMAVLEDRERIARELHDKVIQRLFAAGMSAADDGAAFGSRRGQEPHHAGRGRDRRDDPRHPSHDLRPRSAIAARRARRHLRPRRRGT